jgi:hypothetical protein
MVKVKKSDFWVSVHAQYAEPFEEFDQKKIEMALVRAGARNPDVEEIAAKVKPFEGITTDDIDSVVVAELEKRDPSTVKYWKIKRDYNKSRFKTTK